MIIRGTSSLHDWQCRVEQIAGTVTAIVDGNQLREVRGAAITAHVNSIRSIREDGTYYEKGMDKNIYRAMKPEQHPTVTFTVNKVTAGAGVTTVTASGSLKIAGVTKPVSITASVKTNADGLIIEGKLPVKMTDYSIDPPTALFGTIKTGNEVDVHFKMVFKASK